MNDDRPRLTDAECEALLDRLFPEGLAGADVLAEIAPGGWELSPLLACFHPSPERVFAERLQMHRNLARLVRPRREGGPDNPAPVPRPEPTLEEVRATWEATPVKTDEEVTDVVGLCLWDVFSDNHQVIAPDGRVVDLGSFRGSAGFIAAYVGRCGVDDSFDTSPRAHGADIGAPHLIRPAATFSPSDAEKDISPWSRRRGGTARGTTWISTWARSGSVSGPT